MPVKTHLEKITSRVLCFLAASAVTGFCADSTSYTPPAGYFAIPIKARSDNHISLPLVQKAAGFGTVSSAGRDRLTISAKNWAPGQFRRRAGADKASYVAEFVTGPLRGISYDILDNNSDTVVLDTQGDDITRHPRGSIGFGDVVRLRPLWTAASVFGDNESNLQIAPRRNALVSGDAVILPDNTGTGVNKGPAAQLAFIRGSGWRSTTGDRTTDRADFAFVPGQPMNVRRLATEDTSVLTIGHVAGGRQAVYLPDGGTSGNDISVGLLGTESVTLAQSGLVDSASPQLSAFRSSGSTVFRADELMSYGGGSGFNQTPARSFYHLAGAGWREVGSSSSSVGSSVTLEPGRAYLLRKKAGSPGGDWIQNDTASTTP